jgi:hypothetical protein
MRKNIFHPVVATFSLLALSIGLALGQSQTNEMVRVLEVKASDAVKNQAEADGKGAKLTSVLESLEDNINQGIDDTHKFTTLSRNLKSGQVEGALSGDQSLLAAKYILETTVTGFEYDRTDIPNTETGLVTAQCAIRLSGNVEFKKPNGLKSNANFEVSTNAGFAINPKNLQSKKMGDDLLRAAAHEAANQIVSKVVSR